MHMLFPNILFWVYLVLTLTEPPYVVPFKGQYQPRLWSLFMYRSDREVVQNNSTSRSFIIH